MAITTKIPNFNKKKLSFPAFNSVFVANVTSFVFKSGFFTMLEILDSLTNHFSFIFGPSISLVHLFLSEVVQYFLNL